MKSNSHQTVREAIRARLESGEWALGDRIPGEVDLAQEYGCARTTINRALQTLAQEGLLVRKRKGGTRVCQLPVRQAKFNIPVVREQIEAEGGDYSHQIRRQEFRQPSNEARTRLRLNDKEKAHRIETVHLSNNRPHSFEVRWLNPEAVPPIETIPLDEISLNEWLIQAVPFSSGDVWFYASSANKTVAAGLGCEEGAAVFVVERTTWFNDQFITTVKLYYQPGYQLHSQL